VAYGVARRTGEIGIRVALGAQYGDVVWLVLRRTLILVFVGVFCGIGCALAATQLIASMLYEVKPEDPAAFAFGAAFLLAAAIVAAYLPARKAARIDPMTALRCE
jgi:ABC-type antimicrobial peptide transport system permease subunit